MGVQDHQCGIGIMGNWGKKRKEEKGILDAKSR